MPACAICPARDDHGFNRQILERSIKRGAQLRGLYRVHDQRIHIRQNRAHSLHFERGSGIDDLHAAAHCGLCDFRLKGGFILQQQNVVQFCLFQCRKNRRQLNCPICPGVNDDCILATGFDHNDGMPCWAIDPHNTVTIHPKGRKRAQRPVTIRTNSPQMAHRRTRTCRRNRLVGPLAAKLCPVR